MNFLPNRQLISNKVLDEIATDLLEVAIDSKDKESFRLQKLKERLAVVIHKSKLLDVEQIKKLTMAFRRANLTHEELTKLAKTLSKSLSVHYKALSTILRKW